MRGRRLFFSFVLPSMLAFSLSGVYSIVDGYFIGNRIGDAGLSAINIAYPICAVVQAVGTGVGMGGAILYSISKAEGDENKAKLYFSSTVVLLALLSAALTALLARYSTSILGVFGAEGAVQSMGQEYARIIILGTTIQMFATGLIPFIRNFGRSVFAMSTMIAGFLTNILLDYLLVWVYPLGMTGAAAATVIAQGVSLIGAVGFFVSKNVRLCWRLNRSALASLIHILKISLAPFGLTFSPEITLILMNKFSVKYGGDSAVASFACIAYVTSIVYLLLQGIGDGSQPLVSRYHGKKRPIRVQHTAGMAYKTAVAAAVVCGLILVLLGERVALLFGASQHVAAIVRESLPIFVLGLPFLAYVRVTTSYLYATERSKQSHLVVYAEPIFLLLCLLILPNWMGLSGVWVSVPVSQIITALIARKIRQSTLDEAKDQIFLQGAG